jgi:hypothetical protein
MARSASQGGSFCTARNSIINPRLKREKRKIGVKRSNEPERIQVQPSTKEKESNMAFQWLDPIWNQKDANSGYANNVGKYSKEQLTEFLKNTKDAKSGDAGLLEALSKESDQVTITKGLHDKDDHITVSYLGGTWHVNMVTTATGGYRVRSVSQGKR